jgi:hypothetical protein
VKEDRLYLLNDDGTVVQKATEFRDATLNVMTAMGPRTCLKRVDMVFPCKIKATLQYLAGGNVDIDHLRLCLEYGKVHGFGQDRSLQFGRYDYVLTDPTE